MPSPPQFILIAGPNGAGKSTSAAKLLPPSVPYINADEIAKGLPDSGTSNDIAAGRQLLAEWNQHSLQRDDFAVETTLANRALAGRIKSLKSLGYQFSLIYLWLPTVELSIQRVAERVRAGGHNIPEETIRRRYMSGMKNFTEVYRPLADYWSLYLNVNPEYPELVARGAAAEAVDILLPDIWRQIHAIGNQ